MDQTHDRHSYDSRCHCRNCVAYEKQLRSSIRGEANYYELASGPNNIQRSELGVISPIHQKLDLRRVA